MFSGTLQKWAILMTDVDYVIKDGKKYKLDVEKYLNKKSLRISKSQEEIPFDDDEPLESIRLVKNRIYKLEYSMA